MVTPIFDLCDDYVTRHARLDPVAAGHRGVVGSFAPATDYSPDGYAAQLDLIRDTLRRLDALQPTGAADQLAADHLRERLTASRDWHETGEPLRSLRAPFGLLMTLADSVQLLPRTGEHAWRDIAARLAAIPRMLAGWQESLALGRSRGLVAARRQAVEAADQALRYAAATSFQALIDGYGDGPLRAELDAATVAARAGYAETARWLRDEYAPAAADADGVGAARYAVAGRLALGADIDPVEAYRWGWEELRRLEAELTAEADRVRAGAGVDEAVAHLNATEFVVGPEAYQDWLQQRHDEAIARLDGVHFDIAAPLRRVDVVIATNSSSGAPYYTPPSEDLSRPGRTWWPAAARERFGVWAELTTVFHEGVPGHHLQLGQTRVAGEGLSRFSRTSGVSGHGEGWALYAERLADELGWFATPGQRLGMLIASTMRAARVVIDIGLHLDLPLPADQARRHGERWSFEVATEVLRERGRLAEHRVHPEVVRYCGWPAQATAYKLGERAWLGARDEARTRLGPRFAVKEWHTDALSLGPVGLATLGNALRGLTPAR